MATLGPGDLGLLEIARRSANGSILRVAEVISVNNQFLAPAVWQIGNEGNSHVVSRRDSYPTGTRRRINKGIGREVSATTQIRETMQKLEGLSRVDRAAVMTANRVAGGGVQLRQTEDLAFMKGLTITFADDFIYGNVTTNVDQMNGLAPRTNALSQTNTVGQGGSGGDTTSIWCVKWGLDAVSLIYPPGTVLGITMRDLGERLVQDSNSDEYLAFVSHFELNVGLAVADERCIQRLANIETSGSNSLDEDNLINMLGRLPEGDRTSAAFYMNQGQYDTLNILSKDKTNVDHSVQDAFGRIVTTFQGVPIYVVDAITNTETVVA